MFFRPVRKSVFSPGRKKQFQMFTSGGGPPAPGGHPPKGAGGQKTSFEKTGKCTLLEACEEQRDDHMLPVICICQFSQNSFITYIVLYLGTLYYNYYMFLMEVGVSVKYTSFNTEFTRFLMFFKVFLHVRKLLINNKFK